MGAWVPLEEKYQGMAQGQKGTPPLERVIRIVLTRELVRLSYEAF